MLNSEHAGNLNQFQCKECGVQNGMGTERCEKRMNTMGEKGEGLHKVLQRRRRITTKIMKELKGEWEGLKDEEKMRIIETLMLGFP